MWLSGEAHLKDDGQQKMLRKRGIACTEEI
jgi:hypothetical protein